MKIVKRGTPPSEKPQWWLNRDIECVKCSSVFQLEGTDIPEPAKKTKEDLFNFLGTVAPDPRDKFRVTCPVCQADVHFFKPFEAY